MSHFNSESGLQKVGPLPFTDMAAQCRELLAVMDEMVKNTRLAAPAREKEFMLTRPDGRCPDISEARLVQAVWKRWGPYSQPKDRPFVDACPWIQTYQMPTKRIRSDSQWGEVDLVGISPQFLPVVVELKQARSKETPLRMLVQAAAYGIAVREAWRSTRQMRYERVCALRAWDGASGQLFPIDLDLPDRMETCPLICAAPALYWQRYLPLSQLDKDGAPNLNPEVRQAGMLPPETWGQFHAVLEKLRQHGLPALLVSIDGDNRPDGWQPSSGKIIAIPQGGADAAAHAS